MQVARGEEGRELGEQLAGFGGPGPQSFAAGLGGEAGLEAVPADREAARGHRELPVAAVLGGVQPGGHYEALIRRICSSA